jgi:Tol biopolymer transport system component
VGVISRIGTETVHLECASYDWIGRGRTGRNGFDSRWRYHVDDDAAPIWSPDGRELLFSSLRTGELRLFRKVVGGGDEELLLNSEKDEFARKFARQIAQQWLEDGSIIFSSTAGSDSNAFYLWPSGSHLQISRCHVIEKATASPSPRPFFIT